MSEPSLLSALLPFFISISRWESISDSLFMDNTEVP